MMLLNEDNVLKDIFEGKDLDPYKMRYMCRVLTRYYYGQGVSDQKEIRRLIFTWANERHLYIKLSLKHLIMQEIDNYRPINHNNSVWISQDDIDCIKSFSHKKVMRKTMLGFICYAKLFNINNELEVCIKDLANWMGYTNMSNFYNYQLRELLRIGFIKDLEDPNKFEDGHITKCTRKLYVNCLSENVGCYEFNNDNFEEFYSTINWD